MRRPLAAAVLAVVAVVGCGGPQVRDLDQAEQARYRAEVTATSGHAPPNWAEYLAAARGVCELGDKAFGYAVTLSADGGRLKTLAVDVRYVCPDRLEPVESALRIQEAG